MQQTLDQLHDLKLTGFIEAWQEQQTQPTYHDLSFDERLALLVEREHLRLISNDLPDASNRQSYSLGRLWLRSIITFHED